MKKTKRLVALLLVLAFALSYMPMTGIAIEGIGDGKTRKNAAEYGEIDPSSLNVKKLGVLTGDPETDGENGLAFDSDDTVRVSIFFDEPAAGDVYSLSGISGNRGAASYRTQLKNGQKSVQKKIEKKLGKELNVKWNLTLLANAVSVEMKYGDIAALRSVEGVKRVELENRYEPEKSVRADSPDTANTSSVMVGAQTAWSAGYTGAGSKIAIIDTGIDINHQSFNAEAFEHAIDGMNINLLTSDEVTALLNTAGTLNGAGTYVSSKIPFAYNYVDGNTTNLGHDKDDNGNHGSHVAGIAAANRYIKSGSSFVDAATSVYAVGMAPDAQLILMKVFGAGGGAYDSDYMAAIEDAIVLGCDAANLSLGSGVQGWTYAGEYQAILNKLSSDENPGMVVTISAGNSGALTDELNTDLYAGDVAMHTGGSPGTYINSLGTASADNIGVTGTPLTVEGRNFFYTETESTGAAMNSIAGTYDFVYVDAIGNTADYTAVNSAVSLSGKIVIVNRGDISFYEKGNNLISFSPKALIVANNQSGSIGMSLDDYTGSFPMVSITLDDANFIKDNGTSAVAGGITYYTGSITVTAAFQTDVLTSRENATVSEFSSWGVPGSLLMKPEITAPGGDIYSVWGTTIAEDETGGTDVYGSYSGTSMAAPHMAGLAALVAQYLKDNNITINGYSRRAVIQSLLMSTATPMINDGAYVSLLQQGAGLADASLATGSRSVIMMTDAGLTTTTGAAADGKVKFEMGDDPARTGEYYFSFRIYNISDGDLYFADPETDVFTQDCYFVDDATAQTYEIAAGLFADRTTLIVGEQSGFEWIPSDSGSHDVNNDGYTDSADAQAILDWLTQTVDGGQLNLTVADVDGDGAVTSYDAHLILAAVSGNGSNRVPAGGYADVTVWFIFDPEAVVSYLEDAGYAEYAALYEEYFEKGAYIEGFTYVAELDSVDGAAGTVHTVPILGYWGSWTDPSMFDNTSYTDVLYGTEKEPYSGKADTNYITLSYDGVMTRFSGNPYAVEEEFPYDRLAVNSHSKIGQIIYNQIRAAGTTGFAVSKLDGYGGNVTGIVSSSVVGNEVDGIWFSQSQGTWQNTGTKFYSVGKSAAELGLSEGEYFRVGFYAFPEYYGMLLNADPTTGEMTDAECGILTLAGFKALIQSGYAGNGAFVGYDFRIDDTDPVIASASLQGNVLTVSASDDRALAYVAVLSLDGETVYAEEVPGTGTFTVSFDASDAIANARGYVAVFAGDYAGNEAAVAIKVNDNNYEDRTVYVLDSSVSAGNDYLIASRNTAGSGYILGHTGTTVASNAVTVNAGISWTEGAVYIDSRDVAETSVWAASSGIKFKNGNYYVGLTSSILSKKLSVSDSNSNNKWSCSSNSISQRSGIRTYYINCNSSNNSFEVTTSSANVYVYRKTVIRMEVDPFTVSSISITPSFLDLYKGNEADAVAKVKPITASDRTVIWSSSNPSVATVSNTGRVTAVSAGECMITATSNSNSDVSASCPVKVTSVNKTLNGIIWDEEGGGYFSSFNTSTLPSWTKLHSDAKNQQLASAFMQSSSNLYAATLDTSSAVTHLYSVNRSSYALTEYGENYLWATDMAIAATTYSDYVGMAYTFAYYLVGGPIAPEDDGEGGTYCGLPYAFLDCSEVTGGAYLAGITTKSRSSYGGTFFILDENGIIWQTTLDLNSAQDGFDFSTPTKVVETGISTSFIYQTLYYDGTYIYWGHTSDDGYAELIIVNPTSGSVYHAGDFGEDVWPATGFYVDGSVAPASAGEPATELMSTGIRLVATRDEIMSAEINSRLYAEAEMMRSAREDKKLDIEPIAIGRDIGGITLGKVAGKAETEPAGNVSGDSDGQTDEIVYTETLAVTNGFVSLEYDPDVLSFVGIGEDVADGIYSCNSSESGIVKAAFAFGSTEEAGSALCTFIFSKSCDSTTVTLAVLESNNVVNGAEPPVISQALEGHGHTYGEPEWTWSSDHTGATATFICANNESHTVVVTATVTTDVLPDGSTKYTATVEFEGEDYSTEYTSGIPANAASNITSTSVSFDGKLYLNTYIKLSADVMADVNAYVRVSFNDAVTDHSVSELIQDLDNQGRVKVRQEVYAAMMRDEMTLQVYGGDGTVKPLTFKVTTDVTDGFEFTVLDYLKDRQQNSTNPAMRELARAAELYGIAVQVYFGYRTEQLTADDIAAMQAEAASITIPVEYEEVLTGVLPAGITKRTTTVFFESDNSLRQYFYIDDEDIGNYTFWLEGSAVTPVRKESGKYYIEHKNIASGLLDETYTFSVSDGTDTYTIVGSAISYAYNRQENSSNEDMIRLAKMLYLYCEAANDYFGS